MDVLVIFFYVLPAISVLCFAVGALLTLGSDSQRPALVAIGAAVPTPLIYAIAWSVIALSEPSFLPVGLLAAWFVLSMAALAWAAASVLRHSLLQRAVTISALAMPLPAVVVTIALFVPFSYSA
jgi:hypothetical protein